MISSELLKDVSFPAAAMQCRNATCDDHSHLNEIILFYSEIISALTKASKAALSYHQNTPQYSQVPGWNKKIKSLHSAARYAFLTWVHNGRPKHGVFFEKMKVTRKKFKLPLRHCRRLKKQHKSDALAMLFNQVLQEQHFGKKYVQCTEKIITAFHSLWAMPLVSLMLQICGKATTVDF